MAKYLSLTLDDGTTVLFQSPDEDFTESRGGPDDIEEIDPRLGRLDGLAKGAAALCSSLRKRLSPDEISLELGGVLSGEVGWVFAKSSAEASVKITLKWKSSDQATVPA